MHLIRVSPKLALPRQGVQRGVRTLAKALVVLRENGWCQGVEHNYGDDTFCALGAIRRAGRVPQWETLNMLPATQLLAAVLPPRYAESIISYNYAKSIISYNDARGRKRGQVMGMFRKAIRLGTKALAR